MKTKSLFLSAVVLATAVVVAVARFDWSGYPGEASAVLSVEKPATAPSDSLAAARPRTLGRQTPSGAVENGDPDHIGACPKTHSPVVRRGLDSSGQPTWWHADGSMTVRVRQGYTALDGQRRMIARIVVVRPAETRPDPDK